MTEHLNESPSNDLSSRFDLINAVAIVTCYPYFGDVIERIGIYIIWPVISKVFWRALCQINTNYKCEYYDH